MQYFEKDFAMFLRMATIQHCLTDESMKIEQFLSKEASSQSGSQGAEGTKGQIAEQTRMALLAGTGMTWEYMAYCPRQKARI